MAATLELDPIFVKALKLLHSKSRDSADQLKQMLDDAIRQRKEERGEWKDDDKPSKSSKRDENYKKREHERKIQSKHDSSDDDFRNKKLKLDLHSGSESRSSDKERDRDKERSKEKDRDREKERDRKEKERQKEKEKEREREKAKEKEKEREHEREMEEEREKQTEQKMYDSDTESEGTPTPIATDVDADNFAMDLGIACVVCKMFDVSSGNQLVECNECHNLYHQECHKPPVEEDVNDPRFVWYCYKCAKNLKKAAIKPKSKLAQPPAAKEVAPPKQSKPETTAFQAFKRVEPKSLSHEKSQSAANAKAMSGWAGLANLSHKNETTKSKSESKHTSSSSKSESSHKSSSSSSSKNSSSSSSSSSATAAAKNATISFGASLMSADKKPSSLKKSSSKHSKKSK